MTVNGIAQPFLRVQRRKYRFRLLNGSNARQYHLRLSSGAAFLVLSSDCWLVPEALAEREIPLAQAQRADVIVDFRDAPDRVYLENVMVQTDGSKPKGIDRSRPHPLLEFRVEGASVSNDVRVDAGTPLRPYERIRPEDIVATRAFEFERSNGAWVINGRHYNPRRADAVPELDPEGNTAERWILKNGGGGWIHPIHLHLEHHQPVRIDGRTPPRTRRDRVDTTTLAPGGEAEVFLHLRSFTGPFVFHCHLIEHEDMRMMATLDPRPLGEGSPLDGVREIDLAVSGVPLACEDLEQQLLFDARGDVEKLEGRGVGFPCDDFEADEGA
jgi:FtsP/CotA-like multicopper oxidase with cupredoxin domain